MDFAMLKTTILSAAIAVSTVAQAQTSVGSDKAADATSSRFDQLDRNRDGVLSRDEANGAEELNTRFSELDRNNDNKLSREEYEVLKSERSAASGASATTRDAVKGAKGKTK
jgi:Ca2+-binding EF-hand superfamily protein